MRDLKLSGAALKWVAMTTMLLDHIGYAFRISYLYYIGRLAFPIFCFLLVEGFIHTSDVKKYMARLLLFAFISEVPFDIMIYGRFFDNQGCNVMFTLFLGLLCLYLWNFLIEKKELYILGILAALAVILFGALIRVNYGAYGIGLILAIYAFRKEVVIRDIASMALLVMISLKELCALPDFLLFHLYNGEKGRQPKWLFYIFYPAHMLVLGLMALHLGQMIY